MMMETKGTLNMRKGWLYKLKAAELFCCAGVLQLVFLVKRADAHVSRDCATHLLLKGILRSKMLLCTGFNTLVTGPTQHKGFTNVMNNILCMTVEEIFRVREWHSRREMIRLGQKGTAQMLELIKKLCETVILCSNYLLTHF